MNEYFFKKMSSKYCLNNYLYLHHICVLVKMYVLRVYNSHLKLFNFPDHIQFMEIMDYSNMIKSLIKIPNVFCI